MWKNQKGQVALFVALVFQVLFVFFAMVVNVGLLVHHKINLQNSVDLAAYYGAGKQAEMLNAIAHINYQIRQSYKLMMFHYHQLGTAGMTNQHPWDSLSKAPRNETDTPANFKTAFCIGYSPVKQVNSSETYCKDAGGVNVPLPGAPNLTGSGFFFLGFQQGIIAASNAFRTQAFAGCREVSELNWFTLARFMVAYKTDLANRKKLLINLANEVSREDFKDLEGQSIKEGIFKTFSKNLTYQSRENLFSQFNETGEGNSTSSVSFKVLNGLSLPSCGPQGGSLEPPKWLSEINIFPYFHVMDADCRGKIDFRPKPINRSLSTDLPNNRSKLTDDMIAQLKAFIDEPTGTDATQRLYKSSLGFEKNPWCPAYVGVSASVTPKIPFAPLGSVTLTARAFAKSFGGRIGPWYGTQWPANADQSSDAEKTDKASPVRVPLGSINIDDTDPRTATSLNPNFARYIDDEVGIRSNLTMSQFGKAIQQRGPIDLDWWTGVLEQEIGKINGHGDPLAWDSQSNKPAPMRDLEIAAVAPDQFDISYYSIDPDFYNNYLVKLERGYGSKLDFQIRGDIGSRSGATDELKKFSVRHQIATLYDTAKNLVDASTKLTYYVPDDFAALLTGWQGMSPENYGIDDRRFAKCSTKIPADAPAGNHVPGSCVAGGRVGYSVKLVDGKFLREANNLSAGGEGTSGPYKNPPPANW